MKEIRSIVTTYESLDLQHTRAVLATVARVEGSSYRRAGARMLVLDDGTYSGGISGGCLEGDALRQAQKAIFLNRPAVVTYDTTQEDGHQIGVGLGCNGIIDVLFTPLDPLDENNPVRLLARLAKTRKYKTLVTVVNCADILALGKCFVFEDEERFSSSFAIPSLLPDLIRDIRTCQAEQVSRTVCYDDHAVNARIFIELIQPATHLVVYGGNYDIPCLLRIAAELGWETTVITDISRAGRALVSAATRMMHNRSGETPLIDDHTAVLLMSHDYGTDLKNLRHALVSDAFYIGILGPKKRAERMFDDFAATGNAITPEQMRRIFAPAGLDIGAATPEEIALSIAAEIRAQLAGRTGLSLRSRQGTIYGN